MLSRTLLVAVIVIVVASLATSKDARCQGPNHFSSFSACFGVTSMYTYNDQLGKCESSIRGGCFTPGTYFSSPQACQQACQNRVARSAGNAVKPRSVCYQPADYGLCFAAFPRYFFDTRSRSCRFFRACTANGNNFASQQECRATCG